MTSSRNGVPAIAAKEYTRGVGVYPGDPKEDFAPVLFPDTTTYRNRALHRPAYHSSSYDYNLTAQLLTDGIIETGLPRRLAVTASRRGALDKADREILFDHNTITAINLAGSNPWVQIEFSGGESPFEIDRIEVEARTRP